MARPMLQCHCRLIFSLVVTWYDANTHMGDVLKTDGGAREWCHDCARKGHLKDCAQCFTCMSIGNEDASDTAGNEDASGMARYCRSATTLSSHHALKSPRQRLGGQCTRDEVELFGRWPRPAGVYSGGAQRRCDTFRIHAHFLDAPGAAACENAPFKFSALSRQRGPNFGQQLFPLCTLLTFVGCEISVKSR